MSNKMLKAVFLFTIVFSLILSACDGGQPAPTEEPAAPAPAPTEEPAMPAEEPTAEVMMPDVDPTGQTVNFWHVWGQGLQ